jgi:hypothetical protein
MISCRPYDLPRVLINFFVAVCLPPQTDAGTKTTLNELYRAISKQENENSEVPLLVAVGFYCKETEMLFTSFLPACHL